MESRPAHATSPGMVRNCTPFLIDNRYQLPTPQSKRSKQPGTPRASAGETGSENLKPGGRFKSSRLIAPRGAGSFSTRKMATRYSSFGRLPKAEPSNKRLKLVGGYRLSESHLVGKGPATPRH